MAGIKVPQHKIFKISTTKLKYYNWDLIIDKKEAYSLEEIVPLFQGQQFRSISKILNQNPNEIDYTKYIIAVLIDSKQDFKRATSKKGFKINGIKFKRFVGTTGGLKNDTVIFVNEEIYDELYKISECNRKTDIPFIPAKLEAYRALFCSSSQEIISPRNILVVKDCITKYRDTVIKLDDGDVEDKSEPTINKLENIELENNTSDGYSLCTIKFMNKIKDKLKIDYIPSGVCLRNAWFKGMLFPFPILEFFDKYRPNDYIVKDIWGNDIDIRDVDIITTESSLKLWKCYDSIEHYMNSYKQCGFEFSVTKISPKELEDEREINYQYLQSYDFTDKDIEELCEPTIKYLKDSMCGDYEQTIKFLGIDGKLNDNSWQQALYTNKYMINDPYIIDSVHRMIKKKINDAKIGKLKVNGNYQIISGDPFSLMQHICGLKVTGLLNKNEIYSKYWIDKNVEEVNVFRSPMTSHNNICKMKVCNNDNLEYWYKYMNTIMIINSWDSTCMKLNGADYDSDISFSTDNKILLNAYINLPPFMCVQRDTDKIIATEDDIKKSNLNGMGNKVGQITNRVTNMIEVQSRFPKDSEEYKIMEYRIGCGQLYQQNELDKIKGIDFKPMPRYWYSIKDCENDFQRSLCANKKPYFFIYNYDYVKKEYQDYIKSNDRKCFTRFKCNVNELKQKKVLKEEEKDFIDWYDKLFPVGIGNCTMNKICQHIEKEFDGYKTEIKHNGLFNYNILKVNRRCIEKHRKELKELCDEYVKEVANFKSDKIKKEISINYGDSEKYRNFLKNEFKQRAIEICPNNDERLNIILDMCYGTKNNRQFCWDCVGDLIIRRLEELNDK